MSRDEFVRKYKEIVGRALSWCEKSHREGLLALEDCLDRKKIHERDIFEYGLRFVIDGTDTKTIEEILSNIVKQEKDEDTLILKNIQKAAVLGIQKGENAGILYAILNSYADITLKEDELYKTAEE
jgi:flagellar motor component MotA